LTGVVPNDDPRQNADAEYEGRGAYRRSPPSEIFNPDAQRHLREQRAQVSKTEPEARKHTEFATGEPVRRKPENHQPSDSGGSSDDRPPGAGKSEVTRRAKEELAGGGGDRSADQQFSRTPGIG